MTALRDWSARDLAAAYAAGSEFDPAVEWRGPSWGVCSDCRRRALLGEDGVCDGCYVAWSRAYAAAKSAPARVDPWGLAS